MTKSNLLKNHNKFLPWVALLVVLTFLTILLMRQLGNPNLGFPDADRILMDGVFIHDFLQDLPLTRIYDYTINYYAQYPALSIGYRPPFFPLVEALFNTVFGVNTWSSRLAILLMAVVGFSAWFLLVQRIFDTTTAFVSSLLLASLPFIAQWGWYTMGEMPLLSMAMLTAYLFYRYVETDRALFLFGCAVAFVATVWTKQTAFYLAFCFLLYLAYDRSLIQRLRQGKTWFAVVLVLAALIPLAVITFRLGDQNLASSVGAPSDQGASPWEQRLARFPEHFRNIVQFQTTWPFLTLSVGGMLLSFAARDRKTVFFWLMILTTFLFFSYVIHKNPRYSIFWLPAFAVFAAYPLYRFKDRTRLRLCLSAMMIFAVGFNTYLVFSKQPKFATGYDQAAAYVLKNCESPTVLVDAYNNGYFTYFMRAMDKKRSMYVLRTDKLLTSSSITSENMLLVHAEDRSDIVKILDDYGIDLIVIEEEEWTGIPIHEEFRSFLNEGPFDLVESIALESNRQVLKNQNLLIYRYRDRKPLTAKTLTLHLPVVGQIIEVPIRSSQ